ncbi:hypothetical protein BGZ76_008187, partial [Entomortierella beljakovae]
VTNMDDEGAIYAYESGLKSQFQDHFAGNPDRHINLDELLNLLTNPATKNSATTTIKTTNHVNST